MAQRPCKKARTSPACSSWAGLPLDIAGEVLRRLPSYADRICFGATCRSWRSSARHLHTPPLLPCLCFTDGTFRGFPADARPFRLPAAAGFHDSCGEWLVFERRGGGYSLVDPFSKAALAPLPSLSRVHVRHDPIVAVDERALPGCRHTWLKRECTGEPEAAVAMLKIVVCSPRLVAAVIGEGRHGKLALCRPGAPSWLVSGNDSWRRLKDMAMFQGKLYAIDHNEDLLAVTVTGGDKDGEPTLSRIDRVIQGDPPGSHSSRRVTLHYLVESGGALLLVRREMWRSYRTRLGACELDERLVVFEADFRSSEWREVSTVGDGRALFVGRWCSRAVRLPDDYRWAADRVFFLEDGTGDEWYTEELRYSLSVHDMKGGIFGFRGSTEELLPVMTTPDGHDLEATWLFPRASS